MSKTDAEAPGANRGKGKEFFQRAETVAETGNWDFAVEMYLEGIKREPENIDQGHEPLRRVALTRKANGGKGPGMMDQLKLRPVKDPLQSLLNAERLFAKDPGSDSAMDHILKAAKGLQLPVLIKWIGSIIIEAQRGVEKPNKRLLVSLGDTLAELELYSLAIQAGELAVRADATDGAMRKKINDWSAEIAITQGKYTDGERQFTENVKDMDGQTKLAQQDAMVKDEAYLLQQIEQSKQEYLQSPTVPGKIHAYAEALLKFEDDVHENEAVSVLTKAHEDLRSYQFKLRVGDIRIRQMTRRCRDLKEAGKKDQYVQQLKLQLAFELEEYTERAANYPTDLGIRYELGRRQYLAGKYDDAITSFQAAQRNPTRRRRALNYLGQSFSKKSMFQEAAETFEKALEGDISEEASKDLRFQLGCVLAEMKRWKDAEAHFSQVAQLDYNYKDVRQRLEAVRRKLEETGDQAAKA